jgi:hypothetical protein
MTVKERERAFMIGAPLAIVAALVFLPAVTFLIIFPRVARAGDRARRVAGLRAGGWLRTMEAGDGRGTEAVGNIQRPEFWGASGFAGYRRVYGIVPGADDAETVETGWPCLRRGRRRGKPRLYGKLQ